jgi:hypothetical protein
MCHSPEAPTRSGLATVRPVGIRALGISKKDIVHGGGQRDKNPQKAEKVQSHANSILVAEWGMVVLRAKL